MFRAAVNFFNFCFTQAGALTRARDDLTLAARWAAASAQRYGTPTPMWMDRLARARILVAESVKAQKEHAADCRVS